MNESHSTDMVGFGSVVKRGDNITDRQTDRQTVPVCVCEGGCKYKGALACPTGHLCKQVTQQRDTCTKGQIWPPFQPKTESCFSRKFSNRFIRRKAD